MGVSYLAALIVAAAGVLLLLGLAVRLFVVLRRFGVVSSTVKSIIDDESDLMRRRVGEVSTAIASRRNRTADPVDTNTAVTEMLGTTQR